MLVLGLASALSWGTADYNGGLVSRRAPLFGVVLVTQVVGLFAALAFAAGRGEPVPAGPDIGWSIGAGVAGVLGISALYWGLAVGRMGVVAPTTGVLAAAVPVLAGFILEGLPRPAVIAGIGLALVAVVLVTRTPGGEDRPSGLAWALLAGLGFGAFNTMVGQLSGAGAFGPLVLIRLVQALVLVGLVVSLRRPWRVGRDVAPRLIGIGLLDMGGNAAFILATQAGHLSVASVLSSLYPVVTVVLAVTLLRERVSPGHVAGFALTGVAIALIGLGTSL